MRFDFPISKYSPGTTLPFSETLNIFSCYVTRDQWVRLYVFVVEHPLHSLARDPVSCARISYRNKWLRKMYCQNCTRDPGLRFFLPTVWRQHLLPTLSATPPHRSLTSLLHAREMIHNRIEITPNPTRYITLATTSPLHIQWFIGYRLRGKRNISGLLYSMCDVRLTFERLVGVLCAKVIEPRYDKFTLNNPTERIFHGFRIRKVTFGDWWITRWSSLWKIGGKCLFVPEVSFNMS